MNRFDELKQIKVLNEMGRRLSLVQQEISRGMFDLEPSQEMFDLLFEIGQEIAKASVRLSELYSYMESEKTCIRQK